MSTAAVGRPQPQLMSQPRKTHPHRRQHTAGIAQTLLAQSGRTQPYVVSDQRAGQVPPPTHRDSAYV